jgi:hypothetical protein
MYTGLKAITWMEGDRWWTLVNVVINLQVP